MHFAINYDSSGENKSKSYEQVESINYLCPKLLPSLAASFDGQLKSITLNFRPFKCVASSDRLDATTTGNLEEGFSPLQATVLTSSQALEAQRIFPLSFNLANFGFLLQIRIRILNSNLEQNQLDARPRRMSNIHSSSPRISQLFHPSV